ncbi:hypothetical protein BZA77DRAFT_247828 [Pyronema omphalodes]|nr:hypothetical protein BZA77DRAFT_247828 [Pyronema omphalodes]
MTTRPEAIALISGGKDSLLALYHAIRNGYSIVALGNLHPPLSSNDSDASVDEYGTTTHLPTASPSLGTAAAVSDELDSFMYQTIGHSLLPLYASSIGLPLYRHAIDGNSGNSQLNYEPSKTGASDETEDLYLLLKSIKKQHPNIVAVTSGAILSNYQRTRVESVCSRLGLKSLAYLWQMQQEEVLRQVSRLGLEARIVKVASLGLDERWLWELLGDVRTQTRLGMLKEKWGLNPAGEGGEYESLVVQGPGWRGRIVVEESERVVTSDGGAYWMGFTGARVEPLASSPSENQESWAAGLGGAEEQNLWDPEFEQLVEGITETSSEIPQALDTTTPAHISFPLSITFTPTGVYNISAPSLSAAFEILKQYTPLRNITFITLILRDMSTFTTINSEYSTYFPFSLPPARACVGNSHIPSTLLLSASFTIPLPEAETTTATPDRKGLHVQSLSYWAPSNIGPYSQSILHTNWWETAGQIGLIPASLSLASQHLQPALSLQHLIRIWTAIGATARGVVVWVTGDEVVEEALRCWKGWVAARLAKEQGEEEEEFDGGQGVHGDLGEKVLVVKTTALPRGAVVEWVGLASDREVDEREDDLGAEGWVGRGVEFVFGDGEIRGVQKGGQVFVGVDYKEEGLGAVEGVMVVPVEKVWNDKGERVAWGAVWKV